MDVRLEDEQRIPVRARNNARQYFPSIRRHLFWDDLDMASFANYAFWNYFTLPALLLCEDVAWTEKSPGVLDAVFPDHIPTHNRRQRFTFDKESGRLMQQDYTVEIISSLATAAQVIEEHASSDGLVYPSRRKVTPRRRSGTPASAPLLIDIRVHDYRMY